MQPPLAVPNSTTHPTATVALTNLLYAFIHLGLTNLVLQQATLETALSSLEGVEENLAYMVAEHIRLHCNMLRVFLKEQNQPMATIGGRSALTRGEPMTTSVGWGWERVEGGAANVL